jgi:sarcosine oxidase, subunit delta
MLMIPCPWCGTRDQTEFQYGGAADVERPAAPTEVSDAEWANYLFFRENPKGPHRERWFHSWGCRRWFVIERDTASHAILSGCGEAGAARTRADPDAREAGES